MKIFTGDLETLEEEIELTLDQICRKKNTKSAHALYMTIPTLLQFYYEIGGDPNRYLKKYNKNRSFCLHGIENHYKKYHKFESNFLENLDIHKEFVKSIFTEDTFIDFEYNDRKNINITEKQIYEIMVDFLQEKYPDKLSLFQELIENKMIYRIKKEAVSYGGFITDSYAIANFILNKYHIMMYDNSNGVEFLGCLVHELGHIVDYTLLETTKNSAYDFYGYSLFLEGNSFIYERQFYNYLLDHGIHLEQTEDLLINFYESCYQNLNELKLLCQVPKELLIKERYQRMSKDDFYDVVGNYCAILVEDEYLPDPANLSLYESITYAYGRILGIYFSYLREHDLSEYQEKYQKFLNLRVGYFPRDFFEQLDVSPEELRKILKDDQVSMKQKAKTKKTEKYIV